MAASGKITKTGFNTIVRKDYENQKTTAYAFKRLRFMHEATAGDSGISLSALVLPTLTTGFTNPSVSDLAGAKLLFNKSNVQLSSDLNGWLIQDKDFKITSNDRIEFIGFTATAAEVFSCDIANKASTGFQVIDSSPIVATGTLAAFATDFNVGSAFPVNEFPSVKIGAVMVWLDGVLQYRNSSNATAAPGADGNYEEVEGGAGLAQIIRFNVTDPGAREVVVTATRGWAERPNDSQRALIESQQVTLDKVVETTATLAGVPETDFQGQPAQPDLKQFGDRVIQNEADISRSFDPTQMTDEEATRLGVKSYSHGTSYNGANSPTVTLTAGGGTLDSVFYSGFVPYQTQDGSWRLKGNLVIDLSSQARSGMTVAVNGLSFLDTSSGGGNGQSITCRIEAAVVAIGCRAVNSTNTILVQHTSASAGSYEFSFDVALASKPIWAY